MTWLDDQSRLMALTVRETPDDWMRRNCIRWGIPWREEYATPIAGPAGGRVA